MRLQTIRSLWTQVLKRKRTVLGVPALVGATIGINTSAYAVNGAMKDNFIVCNELSDLKDIEKFTTEANLVQKKVAHPLKGMPQDTPVANKSPAFVYAKQKILEHKCSIYRAKGTVVIDQTLDSYVCVRAPGALDCVWTYRKGVNDFNGYKTIPNRSPTARPYPGDYNNPWMRKHL